MRLARAVRQLCERIQLPCFAKTSGGSGLHVLIPLAGQLTHAESRALAQLLGQVMVRDHPDLATLTRAVAAHEGEGTIEVAQILERAQECLTNGPHALDLVR